MTEADTVLVDQGVALEAARRDLLLTNMDLWLGYFAVGGELPYDTMRGYLAGATAVARREHNKLALVLNEQFAGLHSDHPVPYLT